MVRQLTRRRAVTPRTAVIVIVTAAVTAITTPALAVDPTIASISVEPYMTGPCATPCLPRIIQGPSVSAASFSGGQLHETLTFHKAGIFVAHILLNPPSHPTGSALRGRTVALGHQTADKTNISFPLGTLTPGRYAVVITPQLQTVTKNPKLAATWVYLTAHNNGKITNIKLINPYAIRRRARARRARGNRAPRRVSLYRPAAQSLTAGCLEQRGARIQGTGG